MSFLGGDRSEQCSPEAAWRGRLWNPSLLGKPSALPPRPTSRRITHCLWDAGLVVPRLEPSVPTPWRMDTHVRGSSHGCRRTGLNHPRVRQSAGEPRRLLRGGALTQARGETPRHRRTPRVHSEGRTEPQEMRTRHAKPRARVCMAALCPRADMAHLPAGGGGTSTAGSALRRGTAQSW